MNNRSKLVSVIIALFLLLLGWMVVDESTGYGSGGQDCQFGKHSCTSNVAL